MRRVGGVIVEENDHGQKDGNMMNGWDRPMTGCVSVWRHPLFPLLYISVNQIEWLYKV